MAEQNVPVESDQSDEPTDHGDDREPAAPEVSSPKLDHLQQTIDDAKDAAKSALSDQPDV
ncbi:hypothetical protein [Nakamurella sp. PAMC28650]|uniref:hypothetical protein n=1 Tax=Nakamurella sp. PAMC28650 TaxID=2762325 RepID=UPI00164ED6F9|nr:hypothetical protein [Nakamurella sp. PAMC28650]QNK81131.1 hypothetical protein H7F38_24280 [Nakamurella sp. PAMC28650]